MIDEIVDIYYDLLRQTLREQTHSKSIRYFVCLSSTRIRRRNYDIFFVILFYWIINDKACPPRSTWINYGKILSVNITNTYASTVRMMIDGGQLKRSIWRETFIRVEMTQLFESIVCGCVFFWSMCIAIFISRVIHLCVLCMYACVCMCVGGVNNGKFMGDASSIGNGTRDQLETGNRDVSCKVRHTLGAFLCSCLMDDFHESNLKWKSLSENVRWKCGAYSWNCQKMNF